MQSLARRLSLQGGLQQRHGGSKGWQSATTQQASQSKRIVPYGAPVSQSWRVNQTVTVSERILLCLQSLARRLSLQGRLQQRHGGSKGWQSATTQQASQSRVAVLESQSDRDRDCE